MEKPTWQRSEISFQYESAILEVDPPDKPSDDYRAGQYLEWNLMRDTEPESLSLVAPEFLTHGSCKIKNICFFKLLNCGIIGCAAIEKFHKWSDWWAGESTLISLPCAWRCTIWPWGTLLLSPTLLYCAALHRVCGISSQGFLSYYLPSSAF